MVTGDKELALKKAREFEKSGKIKDAYKAYLRAGSIQDAARILSSLGKNKDAGRLILGVLKIEPSEICIWCLLRGGSRNCSLFRGGCSICGPNTLTTSSG